MPVFVNCNYTLNMGDITPNLDCINNHYSTTQSILLDEMNFPSKIDLIKLPKVLSHPILTSWWYHDANLVNGFLTNVKIK